MGLGVFDPTAAEATPLLSGSSNVNDDVKREMVRTINDFFQNPKSQTLDATLGLKTYLDGMGCLF